MQVNNTNTDSCDFDEKFRQLRQMFHSRMNGEASMQMKRLNPVYKQVFGVSLPHLREISALFEFNAAECEQLWQSKIREAMIVACLQFPDNEADTDTLFRWSADVASVDMVEFASFLLFSRALDMEAFCSKLIERGAQFDFAIELNSVARALQRKRPVLEATSLVCYEVLKHYDFSITEGRAIASILSYLWADDLLTADVVNVYRHLQKRVDTEFSHEILAMIDN